STARRSELAVRALRERAGRATRRRSAGASHPRCPVSRNAPCWLCARFASARAELRGADQWRFSSPVSSQPERSLLALRALRERAGRATRRRPNGASHPRCPVSRNAPLGAPCAGLIHALLPCARFASAWAELRARPTAARD